MESKTGAGGEYKGPHILKISTNRWDYMSLPGCTEAADTAISVTIPTPA